MTVPINLEVARNVVRKGVSAGLLNPTSDLSVQAMERFIANRLASISRRSWTDEAMLGLMKQAGDSKTNTYRIGHNVVIDDMAAVSSSAIILDQVEVRGLSVVTNCKISGRSKISGSTVRDGAMVSGESEVIEGSTLVGGVVHDGVIHGSTVEGNNFIINSAVISSTLWGNVVVTGNSLVANIDTIETLGLEQFIVFDDYAQVTMQDHFVFLPLEGVTFFRDTNGDTKVASTDTSQFMHSTSAGKNSPKRKRKHVHH